MRVLYLTNKPIFPIIDGGCKAMHQFLLCLLENKYEVDHICVSTKKHPFELADYPTGIRSQISISKVEIDTSINILEAIQHLISRHSYNISRFDDPAMHNSLHTHLNDKKYSFVVIESLFLTPYIETIRLNSKAKIIVRTHNVEHEIWQQLSKNLPLSPKKWYLNRLATDLKNYEIKALNKADMIATITTDDADKFQEIGIRTPLVNIPVAIDSSIEQADYSQNNIFFLGSMNWKPNIEAVQWLVNEILPELRKKSPTAELNLAGSFMNNSFGTNKQKGILNHGFVENSSKFMQTHGILVVPILSGSGVRIKLLEAMALGIPVITTKIGSQGIRTDEGIRIANSTEEFVEEILNLRESEQTRRTIGIKAKNYIFETYSIQSISNLINEQFSAL